MSEDYKSIRPSEEDDPARAKFLEELSVSKKREQSNWREVLAEPMRFDPNQRWRKEIGVTESASRRSRRPKI